MTNCGANDAGESCCTSLEVPSGTYYRTYVSNEDGGATEEADPASVSGFQLDKYLVTVGRFRQFVSVALPPGGGAGWTPPEGSGKHTQLNSGAGLANSGSAGTYEAGWVTSDDPYLAPTDSNLISQCNESSLGNYASWTSSAGSNENLPMNCVNWYEAYAFCIWDGGFLPSEAEWEYAAAGGGEQREYPWGSTVPGTTCPGTGCEYAIYDCDYPSGSGAASCTGVTNMAPVGTATLGAGAWGQLDLVGNMFEWNLDWYADYVDPCTDCAYLKESQERVIRGGFFADYPSALSPPARVFNPALRRFIGNGFRCARTP
jgi:formylglycine-generating enzyme